MASRSPNLQNVPNLNPRRGRTAGGENPVRGCFICRDGFANYYFDYKQMEMAVFGLYAQDSLILETYTNGGDIHETMAEALYGSAYTEEQRDRTKDTNYGVTYGMGIKGMAKARNVSEAEARKFLQLYHSTFPSIYDFLEELKYELKRNGCVRDWFGRRYSIPYGQAYKAVNSIIQGSCAQIFKIALLNLSQAFATTSYVHILIPEHDEFVVERQKKYKGERLFIKQFVEEMVNIPQLLERDFRLRVSVEKSVRSWSETDKQKIEI